MLIQFSLRRIASVMVGTPAGCYWPVCSLEPRIPTEANHSTGWFTAMALKVFQMVLHPKTCDHPTRSISSLHPSKLQPRCMLGSYASEWRCRCSSCSWHSWPMVAWRLQASQYQSYQSPVSRRSQRPVGNVMLEALWAMRNLGNPVMAHHSLWHNALLLNGLCA
jgi:hypothetical protein